MTEPSVGDGGREVGAEEARGNITPSAQRPAPTVLRINVVTIFPEFFAAPLSISIPSKARDAGSVTYNVVDLRDYTHDRHRTVDDAPYGGGAGMVMKPGPF